MTATDTEAPTATVSPLLGLHDIAMKTGESLDVIRKQLRTDPELRKLVNRVSGVFVAEARHLPVIRERLRRRATAK